MDIILLFLAMPVDKQGITLVHITYPPLKSTTKMTTECNRNHDFNLAYIPVLYIILLIRHNISLTHSLRKN